MTVAKNRVMEPTKGKPADVIIRNNNIDEGLTGQYSARIAEQIQAEKEIMDFASIVSHDLRSPLLSIQGFTNELHQSLDIIYDAVEVGMPFFDGAKQKELRNEIDRYIPEALNFIQASASKMDSLIMAILQLSRLGRHQLHYEQVNINEVVEQNLQALAFMIKEQGIEIQQGELPTLLTDRLAMGQIFGNLLSNAVKFLDPDRPGIIKISAETCKKNTIFRIADNGRGIDKADINRIFKVFQRSGNPDVVGEGMGLTYVETLVRLLGGHIYCDSNMGHGTIFTVDIPHSQPQQIHCMRKI